MQSLVKNLIFNKLYRKLHNYEKLSFAFNCEVNDF